MSETTVSVILCVRNGERFLRAAMESVLAQTHPARDLIIVDDGSTDGTAAIVKTFTGVKVINQSHSGIAAARNAGLQGARGGFVAFIDHDDEWTPNKLCVQLDYLRAHPEIAIVACHALNVLHVARPAWLPDKHVASPQPCLLPSALLVRAPVFEEVGGFDETLTQCEDYDWLMRAGQRGWRSHVLPDVLVRRGIHERNMTNDRSAIRQNLFRALKADAGRRAPSSR